MSRRQKLERFQAINGMPNVYQNESYEQPALINHEFKPVSLAGQWNVEHFKRDAPLILELACGRGEYCLGLASLYPDNNYIGVDIKGARIWRGALTAIENEMHQIAFLRAKIEYIEHFFSAGEVDEIWIVFPDPFLKSRKANRRLTAPPFLDRYRKILNPNGRIKLKTDSPVLHEFTLDVIENDADVEIVNRIDDLHTKDHGMAELNIITHYEKMHLADQRKINYLEFRLR
jgi:tRNA (guanine-N7-)-methyltransferase